MKYVGHVVVWMVLGVGGCMHDPPEPPGQAPPAVPAVLTRRDAEPAGQNCAQGGTAIRVGLDRNGNGVLDDDEVQHTDFVCAPATAVLARQDPLPPILACPAGGLAIQTGVDDNSDGILQDAEIDQTTIVCGSLELWTGNFTADDWNDPIKVAALQGARAVVGSLTLLRPVALPLLEIVTGDLTGFDGFELPALRTVTGNVDVRSSAAGVPSLPVLERIGGTLFLLGSGVQALSAPGLREVEGDVVAGSVAASALVLPGLETIAGNLTIQGDFLRPGIGEVHLDHLTSIRGGIEVEEEAVLTDLVLPSLTTIGGDLHVGHFQEHLATLAMVSLHDVGGSLVFDFAKVLTTASLPSLVTVDGDVSFMFAPALATLRLDDLLVVGGAVQIGSPSLTSLSVRSLAEVRGVTVPGGLFSIEIAGTSLASLDLVSLHKISAGIEVADNPVLQTVWLPVLTGAQRLTFMGDSNLESISAPQITGLGSLSISEPELRTMDFGRLATVSNLDISAQALPDLSGLSAVATARSVFINDSNQLHDLHGLSRLHDVSTLVIFQNASLVSLDGLSLVFEISNILQIYNNPALASVAGLANVAGIGPGGIFMTGNDSLASIELTHLRAVAGGIWISFHPSLTTLSGFADLRSVGGELLLSNNLNLPEADIDAFKQQIGR